MLLLALFHVLNAPIQTLPESVRTDRLVAVAKLWAAVKFFHPYLAYREIDWDDALIKALPAIRSARTIDEYAAGVAKLLQPLGDPATRVLPREQSPSRATSHAGQHSPIIRKLPDGILIISTPSYQDLQDFRAIQRKEPEIKKELSTAKGVIFDLRPATRLMEEERGSIGEFFSDASLDPALACIPLTTPGERSRMHQGYVPDFGSTSGGYLSAFMVRDGKRINPGPVARDIPVVFLVNEQGEAPLIAAALQFAGKAAIVAEGGASDAALVTTQRVPMGEGVQAQIRLGELVNADGTGGCQPDRIVPVSPATGDDNPAFQAALELARHFSLSPASRNRLQAVGAPQAVKDYAANPYPPVELRLLAAFKLWAVIHYFFPYTDLMGEDWESAFRQFIPRFEAVPNAREYHLLVAEMATHFHDSHGFVSSAELGKVMPFTPPPLIARFVEDKLTVVAAGPDATKAGVKVGDLVTRVDGEDIETRRKFLARHIASSTPQALRYRIAMNILAGAEGSTAKLTLQNAAGKPYDVTLTRSNRNFQLTRRTGEIYRVLENGFGYVDLPRLPFTEVGPMFDKLKNTPAIILDMRGYPQGTAWPIAPRIAANRHAAAAQFIRRDAFMPDLQIGDLVMMRSETRFTQAIPASPDRIYRGKTVMLIDESTISQAEHSGLFYEVANGTKFVGTPTQGANGDVTSMVLPGGIGVNFTGQAVRHADGRQLQRKGLQPDVPAAPTIQGIRAGRDEVLEAAVQYLKKQLAVSRN